jgi:hypothetical protein
METLFKTLKIEISYDLAILLLGVNPQKSKPAYYGDTCTPMFIMALFTIGKLWTSLSTHYRMNR